MFILVFDFFAYTITLNGVPGVYGTPPANAFSNIFVTNKAIAAQALRLVFIANSVLYIETLASGVKVSRPPPTISSLGGAFQLLTLIINAM